MRGGLPGARGRRTAWAGAARGRRGGARQHSSRRFETMRSPTLGVGARLDGPSRRALSCLRTGHQALMSKRFVFARAARARKLGAMLHIPPESSESSGVVRERIITDLLALVEHHRSRQPHCSSVDRKPKSGSVTPQGLGWTYPIHPRRPSELQPSTSREVCDVAQCA